MNKNKKVYITSVAVITSTLLTISSAFAVDYYPEGPQLNVPVSTVVDGGWELCFMDGFGSNNVKVQIMLDQCTGELIMLAGKNADSSNLALIAAGERSAVFQIQTNYDQQAFSNGTYFYFLTESFGSIGFSRSEIILLGSCDVANIESDFKFCRHIDSLNSGEPMFTGGYRIGNLYPSNNLQTFQVYQSSAKTPSTNTVLLAQAEKQKQDTFILAAATLAIASVSNSLSQLTASLLPKTVCVKKGKKSKSVSVLQACPKGYSAKKR